MLSLALGLLFLLAFGSFYFMRKASSEESIQNEEEARSLENVFREASLRKKGIEKEVSFLNIALTRTMKMYEAARDICTSLDEEKLFLRFKEDLKKFVNFKECMLLPGIEPGTGHGDEAVFSLAAGEASLGYLLIRGVAAEDHPYLTILAGHFALGLKRAKLYKMTQELAITDSLTGLYTRRYAMERLKEELRRSEIHGLSLSFLMIDADDFKECNDKFGHLVGDFVLCEIGNLIKENVREVDMLARFGGEEFMVLAPNTSKENAYQIAERIRQDIEKASIRAYDETLQVTVSIGLATFAQDARTVEDLVGRADWALYQAKKLGKNKVSIFGTFHESR